MIIAAVTGGRNEVAPRSLLIDLFEDFGVVQLRHGGCRGVDADAEAVATGLGLDVFEFPADWEKHGKAAGPIRNAEMLKGADMLLAFNGGRGTKNCVQTAQKMGVPVVGPGERYLEEREP